MRTMHKHIQKKIKIKLYFDIDNLTVQNKKKTVKKMKRPQQYIYIQTDKKAYISTFPNINIYTHGN